MNHYLSSPSSTLALLAVLGMGLPLFGASCEPQRDLFPCGQRVPGDGKIRYCDGADEVCVCGVNRCATRDPDCGESGLRYSFDDDKDSSDQCVRPDDAAKAIDQLARPEEERACPSQRREECGGLNDDGMVRTCGASQRCSCVERRCAEAFSPCESGYRWAETSVCVTPAAKDAMLMAEPNRITGLCDGGEFPDICGVPGMNTTCPDGTGCVCEHNECAIRNPNCESGWQRAREAGKPASTETCLEGMATDSSASSGGTTMGDTGDGTSVSFTFPDPETGICAEWEG